MLLRCSGHFLRVFVHVLCKQERKFKMIFSMVGCINKSLAWFCTSNKILVIGMRARNDDDMKIYLLFSEDIALLDLLYMHI